MSNCLIPRRKLANALDPGDLHGRITEATNVCGLLITPLQLRMQASPNAVTARNTCRSDITAGPLVMGITIMITALVVRRLRFPAGADMVLEITRLSG